MMDTWYQKVLYRSVDQDYCGGEVFAGFLDVAMLPSSGVRGLRTLIVMRGHLMACLLERTARIAYVVTLGSI